VIRWLRGQTGKMVKNTVFRSLGMYFHTNFRGLNVGLMVKELSSLLKELLLALMPTNI
jgi:hypothetical protein